MKAMRKQQLHDCKMNNGRTCFEMISEEARATMAAARDVGTDAAEPSSMMTCMVRSSVTRCDMMSWGRESDQ